MAPQLVLLERWQMLTLVSVSSHQSCTVLGRGCQQPWLGGGGIEGSPLPFSTLYCPLGGGVFFSCSPFSYDPLTSISTSLWGPPAPPPFPVSFLCCPLSPPALAVLGSCRPCLFLHNLLVPGLWEPEGSGGPRCIIYNVYFFNVVVSAAPVFLCAAHSLVCACDIVMS